MSLHQNWHTHRHQTSANQQVKISLLVFFLQEIILAKENGILVLKEKGIQ